MSRAIAARSRGSPSSSATISSIARATSAGGGASAAPGSARCDAPAESRGRRRRAARRRRCRAVPTRSPQRPSAVSKKVKLVSMPVERTSGPGREPASDVLGRERVAVGRLAALVAALEPGAPLGGRAVRERVRVDAGGRPAAGAGRRRRPRTRGSPRRRRRARARRTPPAPRRPRSSRPAARAGPRPRSRGRGRERAHLVDLVRSCRVSCCTWWPTSCAISTPTRSSPLACSWRSMVAVEDELARCTCAERRSGRRRCRRGRQASGASAAPPAARTSRPPVEPLRVAVGAGSR